MVTPTVSEDGLGWGDVTGSGLLPGSSWSASATSGSGFHITVSTFVAADGTINSGPIVSCGQGTTLQRQRDDRGGSRSPPTPSTPAPAAEHRRPPPSIGSVTTTAATLPFRLLSDQATCPPAPTPATPASTLRGRGGTIEPGERRSVGTGVAVALPPGTAGLVVPRSGLAARHGIALVNAPGVIDAGYRGELRVLLLNTDGAEPFAVSPGGPRRAAPRGARGPARAGRRGRARRQRARRRRLRLQRPLSRAPLVAYLV